MVMRRSAFLKDTLREIKGSMGRYLSIFAIVALGVAFFAGIKVTSPDMKLTADRYFDAYNLMDIRLLSTIGFNDEDLASIKNSKGVQSVMPGYSLDALYKTPQRDYVFKVISLPKLDLSDSKNESLINRPRLISGRFPQNSNEALAEKGKIISSGVKLGAVITLSSGTDKPLSDNLKNESFTIVGIVETPYYMSFERGTSSIGSGKVNSFIMIPEDNFKFPAYTDVYATVKDARPLLSFSGEYEKTVNNVQQSLESLADIRVAARFDEIKTEANETLSENRKEFDDSKKEAEQKLSDAQDKIRQSENDLNEGEQTLIDKEAQFDRTIKKAYSDLNASQKKLEDGQKAYNEQYKAFLAQKSQAETQFALAQQQIDAAKQQAAKSEQDLKTLQATLDYGSASLTQDQIAAMTLQLQQGQAQLTEAKKQIADSEAQLAAQRKALADGEARLSATKQTLDTSWVSLNQGKNELKAQEKEGRAQLDESRKKLDEGRTELQKAKKDYEDAKAESDKKLSDAEAKLNDAQKQIDDLKQPKWYVLDRNTNAGFVEYGQASDRMNAIAQVFPVFFFLIAALVCLTTMTRMVDEQRSFVGTVKGLGYSKIRIASKFLWYAASASILGSIAGVLVGFNVFPTVIFNAYRIMFTLPPVILTFDKPLAFVSAAVAFIATTFSAYLAVDGELLLTPALLMRPKAPKPGKRILMERVGFIWKRLSFIQKVTVRNLFRYKKRFLMTVLGVSGCTALLLSGFGLKDSISDIVGKQYSEIFTYQMSVDLNEKIGLNGNPDVEKAFSDDIHIKDWLPVKSKSITLSTHNRTMDGNVFVPQDISRISHFITLRDRNTGEPQALTEEGAILTEKLATKLGVSKGQTVIIKEGETVKGDVKVIGITENYIEHYIYVSPTLYQKLFGETAEFDHVLGKIDATGEAQEDSIGNSLLSHNGISAVTFTTSLGKTFNDVIKSLNYVVLVLIVSAGALAFIVLYNLTNVNISERLREIATIKVLGFYDPEVSSYVFRENFILSILGMLLGLVFGIFLHMYVVLTAEVNMVMFGRTIKPMSFLLAALLTLFFTALVNVFMYFKLKAIPMVESLKSVE